MANNHHPKDEAYLSSVIPKRIRIFEEIQAEQLEQLQSRPHDPIKITLLPDGIVKEGKRWETTPMDIAVQISKGFAKSALVSSVDHVLWDMNRPLEGDCSLEIFGFDSDQGRDTFWHSSALILGHALEQEYGCKLCIGPCKTIDEGFFCDAFYHGELGLNDNHFPNIEAELPIRMADFGVLHRNEESGALSGMTRVRRFVQDDAHIFCRVDQVGEEVKGVLDFIDYVYKIFGFTYELKLSTPEKKYIGDLETWDKAEKDLEKALDNFGKPWVINKGDGAFYGPKIDITVSDAMKRKFQCATLQLDFQLPACFKLKYITKKNEKERPVMIHRAVLGSIERMFAILLEHYKGIWPFWLSPRQAIVCSLSEDYSSYAKQVQKQIQEAGYYVDIDESDRSICKKVADARAAPYNYILVVGQKEATTGQVTVRLREDPAGRKDLPEMSIDSLLDEFKFKTINFL
ncbi:hypothetical protein ARALYDRAFT_472010 [Arabidopsis lyrata subsp. lyrata]|uniref:threonine--tRNA ligase n=1 Tax=Arabidopsis lyrata subsp. lyrata TaxID=81972 RepID=D7KG95_ARALL|nr:hypothetical protein ARALYDRAFT_472010 [Arabidopsis lyrata subsp. lyrata]